MTNLSRHSPAFLAALSDEEIFHHHPANFSQNQTIQAKSHAKDAFLSLPLVTQTALLKQQRIVCIANNPSISTTTLDRLLKPTDIVVLFNHFIHPDFFTDHDCAKLLPKLLFFRQIGSSNLHFGMPPRSNHVHYIETMQSQAPVGMMFANIPYQFPTPNDDPRPSDDPIIKFRQLSVPAAMKAAIMSQNHCRVLPETHAVVSDYPIFSHIHSSAPTSGFLLYRLLLAARYHVKQEKKAADLMTMIMLGFNDEDKTGYFWEGHNWQFERFELANPPTGVERINQY